MVFLEQDSAFGPALKTAAAIAFAAVLLIPTIGKFDDGGTKTLLPSASAQFSFINPNENDTTNTVQGNVSSSTNTNNNNPLLRGLIGSMISTANANATGGEIIQGDYTVAGRWRMFVNESVVQRFVANLTLARTDGSQYYHIFIENIGEHSEFARNNTNISSSHMNVQISADSAGGGIVVPITVEIRGDNKVLNISDITIRDQEQVGDAKQRDILRIIDGQSIYGIVTSVE